MNKPKRKLALAILLVISTLICLLFLNTKTEFLPTKITAAINTILNHTINQEETINTSNYVLLSSLTNSPLFDKMDLLVPSDTYIPNKDEVSSTYSGLFSDTVVASLVNTDIIIQMYGIEITDEMNLELFRDQIVSGISTNRPDIIFDTSHVIKRNNLAIPTIEFSTPSGDREIYSFIALINVNGQFVTVAVNSADYWSDASLFFNTLLENMVLK